MPIDSASLRNWVTIQQRDPGQDAAGQPLTTWSPLVQVWARVISIAGQETYRGEQLAPEVTHRITLRWLDGLTPLNRVQLEDGTVLDILAVNYGERAIDDTVTLTCKQRVAWAPGN